MKQLDKRKLLKNAKNEYLGAILAAKVARRLHNMPSEDRLDPKAKVTSLALAMITEGEVDYEIETYEPRRAAEETVK